MTSALPSDSQAPSDLPSATAGDSALRATEPSSDLQAPPASAQVGLVVIGRNEGERLERCLASLASAAVKIVYVDSGSTDGSLGLARRFGCEVVELDLSAPFTAARARNAGFECLTKHAPGVELVQFVDGDCEVASDWLRLGTDYLLQHAKCAIVCGRRRERYPERSLYNRLCDMEWNTPVGEATWCGGDFLIRAGVFRQLGGFAADMIAGEEPELCSRIIERGSRIERLDAAMTVHDAAITRFGQWWRRMVRSGHAAAELACRQHAHLRAYGRVTLRSLVVWTLILPCLVLAAALAWSWWAVFLLPAAYGLQWLRIVRKRRTHGDALRPAAEYATMILLGKFAELAGALRYGLNRLRRGQSRLIEYK